MKLNKRKCKNCGEVFQKTNPLQFVCSIPCSIEYTRKQNEKKERKEWNQRKKVIKEKMKKISDWKNDLQKEINWIVRELDKDLPCISHPDMKEFLRWDSGHYYGVKAHSDLRFNLHNVHKQNSISNELYGGDGNYASGLIQRYGMDYFQMIIELPLKWKGIAKEKFTIPNIRDIYLPRARKIVREMKEGKQYTREEINQIIGIYV